MNRGRIHACVCYPATAHGVEFVAGQFTGGVVGLAHDRFHLSQRGQSTLLTPRWRNAVAAFVGYTATSLNVKTM
jgi:hypothetical protein